MGGLEQDSIVDLNHFQYDISPQAFKQYKNDIELKDLLKQKQINILVKHLEKDKNIPNIIKKDIYQYLKDTGFQVRV